MTEPDNNFIAALVRSRKLDDIRRATSAFCRHHGISYFLYGACFPSAFTRPYHVCFGDLPRQRYGCGPAHSGTLIDILLDHFHAQVTPEIWSARTFQDWQPAARSLFACTQGLGGHAAAVIPSRGANGIRTVLCLVDCNEHVDFNDCSFDRSLPQACYLTLYLHQAVERVLAEDVNALFEVRLTQRERQCLSWTADGKTALEIAGILGIARRTVIYHLQNATAKLKAVNRYQAIARATVLGLMRPGCQ